MVPSLACCIELWMHAHFEVGKVKFLRALPTSFIMKKKPYFANQQ